MSSFDRRASQCPKSFFRCLWRVLLPLLFIVFVAESGQQAMAAPDLQGENQIILEADGKVVVNFVSTSAACSGSFGLYSPSEILVFSNYLYYAGLPVSLPGYFGQGTELVFYLTPGSFCAGGTYLSTNPTRARITHPSPNRWIVAWEDYTDGDFNDLIVQVDLLPATIPFLDLPYDFSDSTFAEESRDTEQGGKVNAYFDHQYPTYCSAPNTGGCSASDTRAVNFYGYDGDPTVQDQPPYRVVYNGHDGIDYSLPHDTPVLAAAAGEVIFAGEITQTCDVNGPSNTIIISHTNGYQTQYWHLDHFAPGIVAGAQVSRNTQHPIGYVGNTGCSTGFHLHLGVKNPDELVVDPYGWAPKPDAAWYRELDPWQHYHSDEADGDATSNYLWVHPLETVALVDPSASTVISSTSGQTVVTFPAGAYNAPLRVELAEALQSASIPGYKSLYTFSLAGYTREDAVVSTLNSAVTFDFWLALGGVQPLSVTIPSTPTLLVWDAQEIKWRELPTSWDSVTGHAHASSTRLGTFALSTREYSIYLPVVARQAH